MALMDRILAGKPRMYKASHTVNEGLGDVDKLSLIGQGMNKHHQWTQEDM